MPNYWVETDRKSVETIALSLPFLAAPILRQTPPPMAACPSSDRQLGQSFFDCQRPIATDPSSEGRSPFRLFSGDVLKITHLLSKQQP
jgi:hypothetical protein